MSEGHGLTVAEWHAMIDEGSSALQRELLDGEPVTKAPMTVQHAECVVRIHGLIEAAVGELAITQMHLPVLLDERSEPRPDVSVIPRPGDRGRYASAPALLVVEAADNAHDLIYGRGRKAAYYARCGIPDCWIVDLVAGQVLAHSTPASGGYRDIRNLRGDAMVTISTLGDITIPVAAMLGP